MKPVGAVVLSPDEKCWTVECEPHVMLRLKRVFERVSKGSFGTVRLADNPENARELLWFIERYPMTVFPLDYLRDRSAAYEKRQAEIEKILAPEYVPPRFGLAIPARVYQRLAADLVLKTGVLLLADDVGLGKTVASIAMMTDTRTLPCLVVTLTHLPRQWEAELERFAPDLLVHRIRKGSPYDIPKFRGLKGKFPDVLIINYHKLAGWSDVLAPLVNSVVYDEAQELRRTGSFRYTAAQNISGNVDFRLGLTATPIYNYGGEIYNVFNALKQDCLGTPEEFGREWANQAIYDNTQHVKISDPKALGSYLRTSGLMLRRTRKEVGREIPPVQTCIHEIEADPDELSRVAGSASDLAKIILDQGGQAGIVKMEASSELSYLLRQATGLAKAPFVAAFVRVLIETGEKVLLYGWHRDVYSVWQELLKEFNPVLFTGTESAAEKAKSIEAFVKGDSMVMLMSLRAGAGVDGLQKVCRTAVFGELDWSPGVHDQCVGRVARDGQEHPVMGYFLVADCGSDPVVSDVLGLKRAQSSAIRDPDAALIEKQTNDPERIKKLAQSWMAQRARKVEASHAVAD